MAEAGSISVEKEVEAMQGLSRILSGLDPDTAGRVLRWAAERHGIDSGKSHSRNGQLGGADATEFDDIADLFHAANPHIQSEMALVVGYWLQVVQEQKDLEAQQINTELKQLGYGVDNITSALSDLIDQRPRLVIQTRKSGTTRQARKKYRLTSEGIERVKLMITEGGRDDSR